MVQLADVVVDLLEEEALFRVLEGVGTLEVHKCFVQFNCVEVVFDLRELVLVRDESVDITLIKW